MSTKRVIILWQASHPTQRLCVAAMEQSFLAWLRGRTRSLPSVAVGIGDDAAVIDIPVGTQLVATSDAIIDGVDFIGTSHALIDIGWKAMAVNLSDIAAMGATPISAIVTLSLPSEHATRLAAGVYEGILQAAMEFGVSISGGDLSVYDGPLAISITLLGTVPTGTAWLRSGAREGDAVVVTGPVGGSLMGRHLRPQPRVREALALRETIKIHAAIDISDGLSLDLDRLCAASGIGAELDIARIPVHEDAIQRGIQSGRTPIEHALGDGEDFELILAIANEDLSKLDSFPELVPIGTFVGRTGLWSQSDTGLRRLSPSGFIHGEKRAQEAKPKT